ncbi:MAG: class I SAM-dependent RNA methyltransferase [Treponema sp.]|jgi:putative N6-adenine-specific DNA methylase|nr:class I SAM-dependent RNA methyltransferase [Treponema sp.]
MRQFTLLALCAAGAEKVVSNELKKLAPAGAAPEPSFAVLGSGFGRVRFTTDLSGMYRALMGLRTADRLVLEAGTFPAPGFDSLFEGTRNIPWEDLIPRGMGLTVVKVRCSRSRLKAETSIQAVVHKAAAERLCGRYGISRLPEGERKAELRVYLEKDEASVTLDISGEPLFKRGYRREGGIAPLRETTAAAVLLLSGWKRKFPLYDPLCGSGTIVIEAALYGWNQAPGLNRGFALSALGIGNSKTEAEVRRELAAGADYSRTLRIQGSDADEKAAALAWRNLRRARGAAAPWQGEIPGVDIRRLPMDQARPGTEPGFIVTNPPYGRRLGDAGEAENCYREMAGLGQAFPGWKLAVICDHPGFESFFGKKAGTCRELKSGAVDACLYQYEKL